MEDHPLLNVVANWPGRVSTQLAFEARGFLVHRAWQNRMIEFCGEHQSDLLNRYWDEVALETMRCAGKVISDERIFGIEPKYRSAFLDVLFAARALVEPEFRYPLLIRCLFEHFEKTGLDAEFRISEAAFIKKQKKQESERLKIQTTGWTGKKRDVIPFIDEFCSAQAFKRRRNRWDKNLSCGLVFEVSLDLGGNPNRIGAPWYSESSIRMIQHLRSRWEGMSRLISSFTEVDYTAGQGMPAIMFWESGLTLSCSMLSPHPLGLLSKLRI